MFCADVNLPAPHHTCFPTQERGNERRAAACFGRGGARSLPDSEPGGRALPQPGDCGKSAWAPGPSLSDAPVSGLLGQVSFLHGTASFCPGFS